MVDLWKDDPNDDRKDFVKEVEGPCMVRVTQEDVDLWLKHRCMVAVPTSPTDDQIRAAMETYSRSFEERSGIPIDQVGRSRPLQQCTERFQAIKIYEAMVAANK